MEGRCLSASMGEFRHKHNIPFCSDVSYQNQDILESEDDHQHQKGPQQEWFPDLLDLMVEEPEVIP